MARNQNLGRVAIATLPKMYGGYYLVLFVNLLTLIMTVHKEKISLSFFFMH